jgi:hypothetical protein
MRHLILPLLATILLAACSAKESAPSPNTGKPVEETLDGKSRYGSPMLMLKQKRRVKETEPSKDKVEGDIINQLYNASMAFGVPENANIDDNIKAELLIDMTKSATELEKTLTIKERKIHDTIKVSHIIRANLVAPDFKVTNITPEEQALSSLEPTQWRWILEPTSAGTYDVNLIITAIVNIDDQSSLHTIKTYDKTLYIEITPKQRIKMWLANYWQWLFSTLLLPFGLWVYRKRVAK